jgi:hypothetical protein
LCVQLDKLSIPDVISEVISLRSLCVLCVSAVLKKGVTLKTAETGEKQRERREENLKHKR